MTDQATDRIAQEKIGRFGRHSDPAKDFCLEVHALGDQYVAVWDGTLDPSGVKARIDRAMEFVVGGDPAAIGAKQALREIEAQFNKRFPPKAEAAEDDGWQWAVVEVMGHRSHAGRTRDEERIGIKMLRIDVPIKGDAAANGWETIYYTAPSIFSFRLCDEATAVRANKPYAPASRYRLPPPEEVDDDGPVDDENDLDNLPV